MSYLYFYYFFSSRRRHTRSKRDWSSDVCSSDLLSVSLALLTYHHSGHCLAVALTSSDRGRHYSIVATGEAGHSEIWAPLQSQIGRASCREREKNTEGKVQ